MNELEELIKNRPIQLVYNNEDTLEQELLKQITQYFDRQYEQFSKFTSMLERKLNVIAYTLVDIEDRLKEFDK